jgi:hypothetical protein
MSMMNICREFGRAAMNRAQRGLYAGREVTFGNNVSFSERKYVFLIMRVYVANRTSGLKILWNSRTYIYNFG